MDPDPGWALPGCRSAVSPMDRWACSLHGLMEQISHASTQAASAA
jgi:hypothetical protein